MILQILKRTNKQLHFLTHLKQYDSWSESKDEQNSISSLEKIGQPPFVCVCVCCTLCKRKEALSGTQNQKEYIFFQNPFFYIYFLNSEA